MDDYVDLNDFVEVYEWVEYEDDIPEDETE